MNAYVVFALRFVKPLKVGICNLYGIVLLRLGMNFYVAQ